MSFEDALDQFDTIDICRHMHDYQVSVGGDVSALLGFVFKSLSHVFWHCVTYFAISPSPPLTYPTTGTNPPPCAQRIKVVDQWQGITAASTKNPHNCPYYMLTLDCDSKVRARAEVEASR